MRKTMIAAVAFLTACGGPIEVEPPGFLQTERGEFQTNCGMWYDSEMGDLQQAEDSLILHFPAETCKKLKNWRVRINPLSDGNGWKSQYYDYRISGLTWCEYSMIEVEKADWTWSSYTHEVAHLLDCPNKNPEHIGWDTGWQDAAILRAQGK